MTDLSGTSPSGDDDAHLVKRARTGDRDAFGVIYGRYADRVHDFCHSLLRDRHEAADVTQETFLIAARRLHQLREPDKLRPWLYAIARNEAMRRGRSRKRTTPTAVVADVASERSGPEDATGRADATEIVWAAAAGLSARDRVLLDLTVRQGLEGQELADAIGASPANAYVMTSRLRAQVERAITALLVARFGRGDCPGLDALLAGWAGRLDPLIRKRVARHIEACDVCTECRALVASPMALLAAMPLVPAPAELRDRVLERVELVSHVGPRHGRPRHGRPRTDGFPPPLDRPAYRRRPLLGAAAAAVAVLLVLGALAVRSGDDTTVAATGNDSAQGDEGANGEDEDDDDRARARADDDDEASGTGSTADATAPGNTPSGVDAPPGVIPVPHDAAGNPVLDTTGEGAATGSGRSGLGSVAPGGEGAPTGPDAPAPEGPNIPETPPIEPAEPAAPAAPANVTLDTTTVDLGRDLDRGVVTIRNEGATAADWGATPAAGWLSVSPASGTLAPGASADLVLAAERDAAPEGEGGVEVPVSVGGEVVGSITVSIDVARAPTVTNLATAHDALAVAECGVDATDVTADVVDESGLGGVVLVVTDPRGVTTETDMTYFGAATWTARLGPFDSAGTATWTIVATDPLGNETRTEPQTITVGACPRPG